MSARAMWKGVLRFGKDDIPVKLYSALEQQRVSFRLLSRQDNAPVKQVLIDAEEEQITEYGDAGRGFLSGDRLVALSDDELEEVKPEPSRDIELLQFLPAAAIDYRWFERPYFLGPDGDKDAWSALAAALAQTELTGVARWVMRNKEYYGALRLYRGIPLLLTLHTEDEVLQLDDADLRDDRELDRKQLAMARQLIEMLAGDFEPESLVDEYRESVLDLIERKRQGKAVKPKKVREQVETADLTAALQESLKRSEANA